LIGDTADEFAAQTIRLLRDPQLREHLARHSRRLVEEKYSWLDIGQRFRRVVEDAATDAVHQPGARADAGVRSRQ
jgi:glycosyltransferase involved in cell wall biosynthesis